MYPRVFILCTGRCGSDAFIRACSHITNYTAGHETRSRLLGDNRFSYPLNHIEADNRLAWLLGRLDHHFGDDAFFVHLSRDSNAVAESYAKRLWWEGSIPRAYRDGILMLNQDENFDVCLDYVNTVNSNIELFLRDKENKMSFSLEKASDEFQNFWHNIGAKGNLNEALLEWNSKSNTTQEMLAREKNQKLDLIQYGSGFNPVWLRIAKRIPRNIKKVISR